jgi:dihydrofolate synthase/folylpolyglutamate synthase
VSELSDPRYRLALGRLAARGRFGIRLGLGRTRALLRRLGDPHLGLRGALIGGTNGKGSVQALVGAALREQGYVVGQTPKPHLISYRERIMVSGEPIGVSDFAALVDEVLDHADAIASRYGPPTEFEVLTAAAFAWFARAGVEVGVIEVGLGGRLDATNVWQGGVSAITNVALDHMEHLGNTIEAIAREKAHIIKRGDRAAVTGAQPPALDVIRRRASRVGVPLRLVEPLPVLGMDLDGLRVLTPEGEEMRVGLLGRHQAGNAAVAIGILDALAEAGIARVDGERRDAAFAAARWPGRLELIREHVAAPVLLDGAHNPAGMAALAAALRELLPQISDRPPTVLIGTLANHWQPGMLDPLRDALPEADVFATSVPDSTNSLSPLQLAAAWGVGAAAIEDTATALEVALERARTSAAPLVVCGSLYLVGYVRGRLHGRT